MPGVSMFHAGKTSPEESLFEKLVVFGRRDRLILIAAGPGLGNSRISRASAAVERGLLSLRGALSP